MPEDIRKHLITSTLDMVEMTRRGSGDEMESNLDMWGAVHGSFNMTLPFAPDQLEDLVKRIRAGDPDQLQQAIAELTGPAANVLLLDAQLVLAAMLQVCCDWADNESGTEAGDRMLTYVRDHLHDLPVQE